MARLQFPLWLTDLSLNRSAAGQEHVMSTGSGLLGWGLGCVCEEVPLAGE